MLCCIFHVIRVLSVWFTLCNFVNTIVYWICIILDKRIPKQTHPFQKSIHTSEWVHQNNRSSHPNSLTHSQFTFVPSPHSQLSLFYSIRERKRKTPSPAQYSIPNKRKWKSYLIRQKSFLGQAISSPNQSLYNHIEAFLVIRDFISSVLRVFGLRKTLKRCFYSTKFGSPFYHTMRNSLDLKNWLWYYPFDDRYISGCEQDRSLWPSWTSCGDGESHQYTSTWSL